MKCGHRYRSMMQPEELARRIAGLVTSKRSAKPTVVAVGGQVTGDHPGQVESVGSAQEPPIRSS